MSSESPTLFTMPPSAPFQDALAIALSADPSLGGTLGADIALTDITLVVPTRRAVRGLTEAFLRANDGRPMLLPRIQPLGEVEEDELSLLAGIEAEPGSAGAQLDIPPAIPALERHLTLAKLIEAWRKRGNNLDLIGPLNAPQASALAADLGRFLDLAETEEVELSALKDLVPDTYAQNWQLTLEFLQIITQFWPDILADRDAIDPAARRKALLNAQCAAWKANPPKGPIIAAGSTGSIKAVARLLATIAHLPQGAVVLPGLDQSLDAESWDQLGPSHPQYGLKELLDTLDVTRADVPIWPSAQIDPETPDGARDHARARLLSELMRPAETTDQWQQSVVALKPTADKALEGIRFIQASSPREEATAIALLLREVLETPGKTAALITPDRNLARRVAAELSRWDVEIDDSAG
ncbi:MAG: double-strand break repair protein AddB, partial [Parvibaculaceae bacterium]|nr:double-strand break repair protein AddB [Parvibaculaceae bacterium]